MCRCWAARYSSSAINYALKPGFWLHHATRSYTWLFSQSCSSPLKTVLNRCERFSHICSFLSPTIHGLASCLHPTPAQFEPNSGQIQYLQYLPELLDSAHHSTASSPNETSHSWFNLCCSLAETLYFTPATSFVFVNSCLHHLSFSVILGFTQNQPCSGSCNAFAFLCNRLGLKCGIYSDSFQERNDIIL